MHAAFDVWGDPSGRSHGFSPCVSGFVSRFPTQRPSLPHSETRTPASPQSETRQDRSSALCQTVFPNRAPGHSGCCNQERSPILSHLRDVELSRVMLIAEEITAHNAHSSNQLWHMAKIHVASGRDVPWSDINPKP